MSVLKWRCIITKNEFEFKLLQSFGKFHFLGQSSRLETIFKKSQNTVGHQYLKNKFKKKYSKVEEISVRSPYLESMTYLPPQSQFSYPYIRVRYALVVNLSSFTDSTAILSSQKNYSLAKDTWCAEKQQESLRGSLAGRGTKEIVALQLHFQCSDMSWKQPTCSEWS